MRGENILHLNIANVITVGIIILAWVMVWAVIGQGVRRALGFKGATDTTKAGAVAAGIPSMAA